MTNESALVLNDEPLFCTAPGDPAPPVTPEVWSALYTNHYRYVLQVCRGFFNQPEDAEDAAAEVFLKLYKVLHQKDHTVPFRPWVSRVAGHHCIDKIRKKQRERISAQEEGAITEVADHSTPSALSELMRRETEARLRRELARLPERHRRALVLRYYKRMSYSEIARVLNTRQASIRVMMFRAKSYLRRNLRSAQKAELRRAQMSMNLA
jgi:RNA polymerase sigma-70 factor, ECF subfamily